MSLRINNAKNFKGKSYIVTDQLDDLLKSMSLTGNSLTVISSGAKIDGDDMTAKAIDLSGLVKIESAASLLSVSSNTIDASGLTTFIGSVVADKVVVTDSSGNLSYTKSIATTLADSTSASADNIPTEAAVRAAIDAVANSAISISGENGITVSGDSTAKTISNTIKLVKLTTTDGDDAATYELQYLNGSSYSKLNGSDQIHIAKDQFLKSADFGWAKDGSGTDWNATHTVGTNDVPVIKFVVYTTTTSGGSSVTADKTMYIDCTSFYREYSAGDRVSIDGNTIKVVVGNGIDGSVTSAITIKIDTNSESVYTSKGVTSAALVVTSDGVKVQNIQAAIDNAINDEHAKTSAAIDALNTNIEAGIDSAIANVNTALGSNVTAINAAITSTVTTVNAKVDSAVANINTAAGNLKDSVNSAISSSIASVDAQLTSTVANVNTQVASAVATVSATVGSINTNVSGLATSVNGAITSTVANVKDVVQSAVTGVTTNVNTAISSVNTNVSAFQASVASAVANVQTNVDTVTSSINNNVTSAIASVESNISAVTSNVMQILEGTVNLTSGVGSIEAKYIIAVFESEDTGVQIYPEIKKNGSAFTLTGDGSTDSAWKVVYAKSVPSFTGTTFTTASYTKDETSISYTGADTAAATTVGTINTSAASYTAATNSVAYSDASKAADATAKSAAYTSADDGTDASATSATKVDTGTVDVTDASLADNDYR